ncbi:hypothetical protein QYF36_012258 [Acer negundo]|nr:hypothetical protein QYF36_012258 [Acer negundo]
MDWIPPPFGCLKRYTDAAVKDNLSFGVGVFIRNHEGLIIDDIKSLCKVVGVSKCYPIHLLLKCESIKKTNIMIWANRITCGS